MRTGAFFLGFGVFFFLVSGMVLALGFHDIDLSYNAMRLAAVNNLSYHSMYETLVSGDTMEYDDIYLLGLAKLFVGFALVCMASAFVCMSQRCE